MSRICFLSVLGLALAGAGLARGDSGSVPTPPPLEARLGKTITLIERGGSPERAVIIQVWRLSDGRPVMQAHSLKTGQALTIIENDKAENPDDRFAIKRWNPDGTPPADCPLPPPDALRIPAGVVVKTEVVKQESTTPVSAKSPAKVAAMTQTPVQPAVATTAAPAAVTPAAGGVPGQTGTVAVAKPNTLVKPSGTAGGLMPPAPATTTPSAPSDNVSQAVPSSQPDPKSNVRQTVTSTAPSSEPVSPPTSEPMAVPVPASQSTVTANSASGTREVKVSPVITSTVGVNAPKVVTPPKAVQQVKMSEAATRPASQAEVKQVTAMTPTQEPAASAPQPASPANAAPVNPAGRHTITVSENGKDRTCVVLKEVKNRDGSVTTHVQDCATGECFTVNCAPQCQGGACEPCKTCDSCKPSFLDRLFSGKRDCATCAKAECPPAKIVEAPKVVEAPKPAPKPIVIDAPKPAPKPVVIEAPKPAPAKVVTHPCPAPCQASEPCSASKPCGTCKTCKERVIRARRVKDCVECQTCDAGSKCGGSPVVMMSVPVPGLPMHTLGPCPNVLPPQPAIPVFNPQLSRSMMQACKPGCQPSCQPQSPCSPQMMTRVITGMENVYDVETAQTMKTQVFLLYTLKTSHLMANRQWAAEQLAMLPANPYIADALVQAAMSDTAPLVRMAALRSLAQMRIHSAQALSAMQAGLADADPRVRDVAADSLAKLRSNSTSEVQQTSYTQGK